jgi:hypothetical protein
MAVRAKRLPKRTRKKRAAPPKKAGKKGKRPGTTTRLARDL